MCTRPTAFLALSSVLIALLPAPSLMGQPAEEPQREQIGQTLGKPIYRDQIRTGENARLRQELHRLFSVPVKARYLQEHERETKPTEAEIAATAAYWQRNDPEAIERQEAELYKQLQTVEAELADGSLSQEEKAKLRVKQQSIQSLLKPPGRSFALFLLDNWKLQRHLYEQYGGGRILWQQAGIEAFDATHRWLKAQEQSGNFEISDPDLRAEFYAYWTTHQHGSFLRGSAGDTGKYPVPEWLGGALDDRAPDSAAID
jgi:hypothetical protein